MKYIYIIKVKEDSEIDFPVNAEYISNNYDGTETYEIEIEHEKKYHYDTHGDEKLNKFLENNENVIDYDLLQD